MEKLQVKLDYALEQINSEDFVSAQKTLNEILSEDENNLEAIKNLGLCEVNLDNHPEAIRLFSRAIELDNTDATSLFYLASCQSKIGEKELAVENFIRV